jgi:hypothetical protein
LRFPFGEWAPDLPPLLAQETLTVCKNVVPIMGGYGPTPSLVALDSFALSAAPRGAIRGQLTDGTNFFIAGTETTLERRLEASWSDISRTSGYSHIGTRDRWSMSQLGSSVFAATLAQPLQGINLSSETVFADVEGAPRANQSEVAEGFLWLGDLFDPILGVARDAVGWSAVGNGFDWPDTTTDAATAVLSGRQQLEGNGGFVTGIISGSEVVAVFQENAIHRADFVGNDIVWQFNRMEVNHGLVIPGAAVAFERGVFYIAQDGFRVFNYTSSQNIGKDRVNDWWDDDYDSDYPDSVTVTRDPDQTRIRISYAGAGNTAGVPNKILIWDWVLDKFTSLEVDHWQLIDAGGQAASLDSPDIPLDKDVLEDDLTGSGDLDYGPLSFDDRSVGSGTTTAGAFDTSFQLGTFSGTSLAGTLETGDLELSPGRRSFLSAVRPQIDGEETSVAVATLDKRGQDVPDILYGNDSLMQSDGQCYMRKDGRYHRLRFNLSPQFTAATFADMTFKPSGRR